MVGIAVCLQRCAYASEVDNPSGASRYWTSIDDSTASACIIVGLPFTLPLQGIKPRILHCERFSWDSCQCDKEVAPAVLYLCSLVGKVCLDIFESGQFVRRRLFFVRVLRFAFGLLQGCEVNSIQQG